MSGTGWGPATTDTISRWGHRLLTAEDGSRRTVTGSVDGAPRWLGGVAAGVQAALLSLAVVVVPTLAAYVATSADPTNQDVGWTRSVAVGAGLWLLGHGVPLVVDGVRVTLVPLGLTALALFTAYAAARRSGRPGRAGWGAGVGAYVTVVLVVALLAGAGDVLRAAVGSSAVAAVGLGAGLLSQPGAPRLRDLAHPLWSRVPAPVRLGATGGAMGAAALLFVACGVVIGWLVAWHASVGDVVTNLAVDVIGWTTLALVQLALVPDLVVWALAFIVGPGFVVGSGTHFTAAEIVSGPLPALPLFGALPAPGSTSAVTAWWPLVTVLVGAGVGWRVHRGLRRGEWWHPLLACVTAAPVAGLVTGVLVALASGSIGPGRMAQVGGSGLLVGSAVAIGTFAGAALVALPSNPELRTEASRRWQRVRPGAEPVPDDAPTAEVPLGGAVDAPHRPADERDDDVDGQPVRPSGVAEEAQPGTGTDAGTGTDTGPGAGTAGDAGPGAGAGPGTAADATAVDATAADATAADAGAPVDGMDGDGTDGDGAPAGWTRAGGPPESAVPGHGARWWQRVLAR